jgi:hypothetical protein
MVTVPKHIVKFEEDKRFDIDPFHDGDRPNVWDDMIPRTLIILSPPRLD